MTRLPLIRRFLLALCLSAGLSLAACSMPRVPGLGSYYSVTDPASGQVYYTDQVRREKRGIVEFRDGSSGAWISVPAAQVQEINKDEYVKNTAR